MAIYSAVVPPEQQSPIASSTGIYNITPSFQSLSTSQGTTSRTSLNHPDVEIELGNKRILSKKSAGDARDSQHGRHLLLKGKEGSRRRQRWENANFLQVPNAQPPLPSDWAPHPTHPVQNVPYYLAPLWDHMKEKQKQCSTRSPPPSSTKGKVPQELKAKIKRAKGARVLLQDLEAEIRAFIGAAGGSMDEDKDEMTEWEREWEWKDQDDEIVFVGRDEDGNGITMTNVTELETKQKLVFEGRDTCSPSGTTAKGKTKGKPRETEKENAFMRWLVHELAAYYGLESRSETIPGHSVARRRVIVAFPCAVRTGTGARLRSSSFLDASYGFSQPELQAHGLDRAYVELPRPLWGLV